MIKTQFSGLVSLISEMTFMNFMFENMLRFACGERVLSTPHSREEDDVVQDNTITAAPHVIVREAAISSVTDDPELRTFAEHYGELADGRVIDVPLQELLAIIPRTRRRSDAYKALITKLKRIGVTLCITTNRKGGGGYES